MSITRPNHGGIGEQLGRTGLIRYHERRAGDVIDECTRPGRRTRAGPGSRTRPDRDRDVMSADVTFRAMGSEIRLIIGDPAGTGDDEPDADRAVRESREFIERYEACLSRFRPESELCALNADPRPVVPASPLLRDAVAAGVEAARATGGLVDPTLVDEIENVGYVYTREGTRPARLSSALLLAPGRAPANPSPERQWASIAVDEESGVIRRPPGVRFDSGGIGKGLAADLLAERLSNHQRFVINCGGDLRVGGRRPAGTSRSSPSTR